MDKLIPVEQKTVTFNDAELMAVKANDGKVYAGVKWICGGLGMDKSKCDVHIQKIQADVVLSRGACKINLPTSSGFQDVLCIELNFLPLWLAKINANIIDDPALQANLISYQLKAKDVLAEAFLPKTPALPQTYSAALRELADTVEQKALLEAKIEEDKPKVEFYDEVAGAKGLHTMNEAAKLLDWGEIRLFAHLRDMGVLLENPKNMPRQCHIDAGRFSVKESTYFKNGEQKIHARPFVTPKGLIWLQKVAPSPKKHGWPGHRPGGCGLKELHV
ncbi:MAG: phage antirepressor KilAC domain-containing protein [bacterium]